jgi:hypothetical protein
MGEKMHKIHVFGTFSATNFQTQLILLNTNYFCSTKNYKNLETKFIEIGFEREMLCKFR